MSWATALGIGAVVGLAVLLLLMRRRPLRSFKWALLDTIDISAGLLADNVIIYDRGQELAGDVNLDLQVDGQPSTEALKLLGVRIWNGGLRTIEPSDFDTDLEVYVPMSNVIGLVSVKPLRPEMTQPQYESGFPIRISPLRLRGGEGLEVRVLSGSSGYVSIHDNFTPLKVQELERIPSSFLLGWLGFGDWWQENMDIRVARIVEGVLIAVLVALILRWWFGN